MTITGISLDTTDSVTSGGSPAPFSVTLLAAASRVTPVPGRISPVPGT
ncbi:hypothetical protein NW895_33720 [Streptomyces sp. S.PNR 29]|nr:hypothetical protein [Streptomyces sp. S.PNR 29]MDN0199917.1 hypothetical protein [Streptomyces sp. S.PNR 29]